MNLFYVTEQIMTSQEVKEKRISRWYFGGLASAGAACCTHPLDLLKVTLQTQQEGKLSMAQLTGKIVRQQGMVAFHVKSILQICLFFSLLNICVV